MAISFGEIASNIACSLEEFLPLAMALSFVFGLYFAVHTIFTYKDKIDFKQGNRDMEGGMSWVGLIFRIVISVMFIFLPTYIASAAETLSIGDGKQLSSQFCNTEKHVVVVSKKDAGDIAKNIENSLWGVKNFAEAFAYVAGFFMGMGSLFKFKAYKDNPQQTPLGTPVTWLGISVFMIFLPELFGSGAQTIWGGEAAQVDPWSD